MYHFYFNDGIPKDGNENTLITCLGNTLKEYNKLNQNFPTQITGILTTYDPNNIILNENNCTLAYCINNLEHSLKRIGYTFFTKYPVENFLIVNDDTIISDFHISINGVNYNAFHPKNIADNNGVLFSLALHDDIKSNYLNIINDKAITVACVANLYGAVPNTNFISNLIEESIFEKLNSFEKLLSLFEKYVYKDRFKNSFEHVSKNVQDSIIQAFTVAINRKGKTKFFADGDLIKDVTPERETKIKVFELRIFNPVAYRVYFYEDKTKVYLASIEQKPATKVQNKDIINACSAIKELLLLNK